MKKNCVAILLVFLLIYGFVNASHLVNIDSTPASGAPNAWSSDGKDRFSLANPSNKTYQIHFTVEAGTVILNSHGSNCDKRVYGSDTTVVCNLMPKTLMTLENFDLSDASHSEGTYQIFES